MVNQLPIYVHINPQHTLRRPDTHTRSDSHRLILYADTLLSINQVAHLFETVYDTVHTTIREVEAAFERGFHLVWTDLQEDADTPTQIDETGQKCSGYKGQSPPRDGLFRGGSGEPGRLRWEGAPRDTMTLVGACRDT